MQKRRQAKAIKEQQKYIEDINLENIDVGNKAPRNHKKNPKFKNSDNSTGLGRLDLSMTNATNLNSTLNMINPS